MAEKKLFTEPEEDFKVRDAADLDPMAEPINERPYTKPNVNISQKELMNDIPEPSFSPPPIDLGKPPIDVKPPNKEPDKPYNPQMNELGKKEKAFAINHVAEVIMQGYEWMHDAANKGMVFNERKMNKLSREGEIDFSIQIPYDYATESTMSAGEFVQEYNQQNKNALTVSPDFKEKTMPVLKRVLEKRGIGMTDEQYLIYLFGKDIAVKGVMFMTARGQMNEIIKMMKEMTQERGGSNNFSKQPPPPPPQASFEYDISSQHEPSEADEEQIEEVYNNVTGSVAEQVEAQLQKKSVAQIRREQIEEAKAAAKSKVKGIRGRKRKQ